MTSATPRLLTTVVRGETYGGTTYHIEGELVPVLTVQIAPGKPVYFEHHILLWKHPTVTVGIRSIKGLLKRAIAGMQVFITEAQGSGSVAFSRDGPGQIIPLHMAAGESLEVREHQFLAATGEIDYSYARVKGVANLLFGGSGFFIDRFHARTGDGILWLHGYGNVFELVLAAGEVIDVEPGGWLYKDASVTMQSNVQRLSTGMFAAMNFTMNRFTGPGRLGVQSMYLHMPTEE
ncbi:MAG: AIM24 family protein [Acidisphaera sp.]|nr:AIM24 family protein [Acidisphaera sp.]